MPEDFEERKRKFKRIGQIASIEFQRRRCVRGTKEKYILLDELISTTIYAVKHWALHPILSKNLTSQERSAMIQFHDQVEALFSIVPFRDPNVSIADIVEHNEAMQGIRNAANECLQTVGVSFTTEELMD